jgi:hypothetical protein
MVRNTVGPVVFPSGFWKVAASQPASFSVWPNLPVVYSKRRGTVLCDHRAICRAGSFAISHGAWRHLGRGGYPNSLRQSFQPGLAHTCLPGHRYLPWPDQGEELHRTDTPDSARYLEQSYTSSYFLLHGHRSSLCL